MWLSVTRPSLVLFLPQAIVASPSVPDAWPPSETRIVLSNSFVSTHSLSWRFMASGTRTGGEWGEGEGKREREEGWEKGGQCRKARNWDEGNTCYRSTHSHRVGIPFGRTGERAEFCERDSSYSPNPSIQCTCQALKARLCETAGFVGRYANGFLCLSRNSGNLQWGSRVSVWQIGFFCVRDSCRDFIFLSVIFFLLWHGVFTYVDFPGWFLFLFFHSFSFPPLFILNNGKVYTERK